MEGPESCTAGTVLRIRGRSLAGPYYHILCPVGLRGLIFPRLVGHTCFNVGCKCPNPQAVGSRFMAMVAWEPERPVATCVLGPEHPAQAGAAPGRAWAAASLFLGAAAAPSSLMRPRSCARAQAPKLLWGVHGSRRQTDAQPFRWLEFLLPEWPLAESLAP